MDHVKASPERTPELSALLRGAAYPATAAAPHPRADPAAADRLPADTWGTAQLPVGVRLELTGTARAIDVTYTTATGELGYRGAGAGTTFAVWTGDTLVDEQPAELGRATVRLRLAPDGERSVVHLPEGMRPTISAVEAVDGAIAPAPAQPRWLAYGDSITEGWSASAPALAWPAVAGRRHGLDVVNLGYAGSARAELVSAEGIAALPADVVSIAVGTNCWNRIPHSAGLMRELLRAFLAVVRSGHPATPVVVVSPVVRPDAETTPNLLGATLADLRAAIEQAVTEQVAAGDRALVLVPGADLLDAGLLVDGVHPGDEGHRVLADRIGAAVADAVAGRTPAGATT
ncbi:GDSL-type esterase/lipase family protein [Trujillonella endophytica]|uniref:Lysophospholipase L1 n=1 Tax=Trujillonella endophytica TaxID=673521 RepID=A0A1H8SWZ6_9ACTN|nr:GDSL-type esterase/lipase family protein [Trujillella endophytica]SEO82844.1 Lysophospholipase L1 [Trujillella endophytica]